MTQHGKIIITLGILLFTAGSLLWIILQNWQWFAAGFAIFIGSAFTSLVLSVETKNISSPQPPTLHHHFTPPTRTQDDWQPPPNPPPDGKEVAENVTIDPFYGRRDPNGGTPT